MSQILFQIGKNFYGDFSDVATGLWKDCLSRTQCHEWHQRFKSGRTSIEDDPKSGRPSTSMDDDHVEIVLAAFRQNRRLTVREFAEEVRICKSSCHLFLTEKLKIVALCFRFVIQIAVTAIRHGILNIISKITECFVAYYKEYKHAC